MVIALAGSLEEQNHKYFQNEFEANYYLFIICEEVTNFKSFH